jgi:thiamine transporter ThiT
MQAFVMKSEILFWGSSVYQGQSCEIDSLCKSDLFILFNHLTAVVTVYTTKTNSAYLCVSFEIISLSDYFPKKP